MKLLVAIPSNRPKQLTDHTLAWAPRAGFELRVFADHSVNPKKYKRVIEDVNYRHFLSVRYKQVVYDANPLEYAVKEGYDLLAIVPPNLRRWNSTKDTGQMVIEFHADLANARRQISEDSKLHEVTFPNGARVIRVVKL